MRFSKSTVVAAALSFVLGTAVAPVLGINYAPITLQPGEQITIIAATPSPAPTATPVVTPSPTVAPTRTPSPTPVPTATPSPTVAPTATPAPTTAPSGAVFVGDAETGNTSQFCFVHSGVPVGVVTSPVRAGRYAYKAEIRDGVLVYGTERSSYENGPNDCANDRFVMGEETWTAMSYYLAPDFPVYSAWSLVTQWKEPNAGTPPQQIGLQNERFNIRGRGSESPRKLLDLGPVVRGQWIDFLVHQKWSDNASVGFVEVYRNGSLVLPLTHLATMENGSDPLFLSVGEYRDLSNSGTAILYVDEVRVGATRGSVELAN